MFCFTATSTSAPHSASSFGKTTRLGTPSVRNEASEAYPRSSPRSQTMPRAARMRSIATCSTSATAIASPQRLRREHGQVHDLERWQRVHRLPVQVAGEVEPAVRARGDEVVRLRRGLLEALLLAELRERVAVRGR